MDFIFFLIFLLPQSALKAENKLAVSTLEMSQPQKRKRASESGVDAAASDTPEQPAAKRPHLVQELHRGSGGRFVKAAKQSSGRHEAAITQAQEKERGCNFYFKFKYHCCSGSVGFLVPPRIRHTVKNTREK
jgi:hypothetical protein